MKIAWFTPFVKNSAIGAVSKIVCEELEKTVEVDIWTFHKENLIDTSVKVIQFSIGDKKLKDLNSYDYLVYNLGNFAGNHREIYDVSRIYKGIIVLHDQTMAGFWEQYYTFTEYGGDPIKGYEKFNRMIKKYYGVDGEKDVVKAQENSKTAFCSYPTMHSYNMLEPIVENARGVFTHAMFFCNELKKIYNGPVAYSYLPFEQKCMSERSNLEEITEIIANARKAKRSILVSSGIVHPVKQIDKVVKVLLDCPELQDKICYIVVGNCDGPYGEALKDYAQNELKGCLYMMGYRSYEEMNMAIDEADICFNLRYPNSEVCSLSLLEQMSHKKEVVVIDSGIYGEMPDNAVIKINYYQIYEQIEALLKSLINNNRDQHSMIAQNAKDFVDMFCTAKVYCDNILRFLENLQDEEAVKSLQNRFIASVAQEVHECRFSILNATTSYISKSMSTILNGSKSSNCGSNVKIIGIWAAFDLEIENLSREGIARFIEYLLIAYVKKYGVKVEFWCYSFNEDEAKIICANLPDGSYRIITEKNWAEVFQPTGKKMAKIGDVNAYYDNLNLAARCVSQADIMIPMIVYLDSVIVTGKRIFVPAHDMAVSELFDYFVTVDGMYKFRQADIAGRAEKIAKAGAVFFSNSNDVRKNQNIKHIKNLAIDKTAVIYYPTNIPPNIEKEILSYKEVSSMYGITKPYLFYPTQIRPYKNVDTLIKAFKILAENNMDLKLVLTGNPEDVPEVMHLIQESGCADRIKVVRNVSTAALYSIYKYAEATPVPSLFEGGFPYQACEALFMETPVTMANIEITRERIEFYGFSIGNCGIEMFEPKNAYDLADKLNMILSNRALAVSRQRKFAEVLLKHSWEKTVEEYHYLFEKGKQNKIK